MGINLSEVNLAYLKEKKQYKYAPSTDKIQVNVVNNGKEIVQLIILGRQANEVVLTPITFKLS